MAGRAFPISRHSTCSWMGLPPPHSSWCRSTALVGRPHTRWLTGDRGDRGRSCRPGGTPPGFRSSLGWCGQSPVPRCITVHGDRGVVSGVLATYALSAIDAGTLPQYGRLAESPYWRHRYSHVVRGPKTPNRRVMDIHRSTGSGIARGRAVVCVSAARIANGMSAMVREREARPSSGEREAFADITDLRFAQCRQSPIFVPCRRACTSASGRSGV